MNKSEYLTKENLILFSGEHLYYEIKMLYSLYDILKTKVNDVYVYNALIESFVIHTTILLEFFYKPQIKPDDAKAVHYVKDRKKWKEAIPSFDKYFRKFSRKRNRELVHLSYKRLDVKPDEKIWYPDKTTIHIKRLVNTFLKLADPELIDPKLHEFKK